LYEATSHVPGVLANNKYIEMILEPTSCWEALTYCLKERLFEISHSVLERDWNCRILEINSDRDHVHIRFEAPPQVQPSKLTNNYKTVTSRLLRKEFSEFLKPYYWKPYFWSNSYFICTVSDRTEEMIRHYIQNQGAANPS
jgi:putative transposase